MNNREFDAVCLGFTTVDQTITGINVAKLVEESVYPAKDTTFSVGGDACNEACVLARLGMRTKLVTKLGGDFLGRIVLDHCRADGVDTQSIVMDPKICTTMGIAIVSDNDDRRIIPVAEGRSVNCFAEDDIDVSLFQHTKLVSFASMFVVPLLTAPAMERIFRKAKEAGCIVCADVKMSGEERIEDIANVLPYVDYLFPNFAEARLLTGKTDPKDVSQCFLDSGVDTIVLKLGAPGCYIRNRTEELWIPSYRVDAIDSTGAGDNFAAGFIYGLVRGLSSTDCAKYASAASSLCVRSVGTVDGVKSLVQVESVIAEGEADWAANAAKVSSSWVVDNSKKTL